VGGAAQVVARQRHDLARHGGREEHDLALLGDAGEDALDVGQEAEVEHLVGLVEDDGRDAGQAQILLLLQVEQAPGGADDDVDPVLQALDLRLVGAPAVDGEDAAAGALARGGEVGGDLDGEFAGGDDDQGARALGLAGRLLGPLEQRQPEGEGLAGAGARLPDDVGPGQGEGQGEGLDREGLDDPLGFEGVRDLRADAEVAEGLASFGGGICAGQGSCLHLAGRNGVRGLVWCGRARRPDGAGGGRAPVRGGTRAARGSGVAGTGEPGAAGAVVGGSVPVVTGT
jgi:hypothetical protein